MRKIGLFLVLAVLVLALSGCCSCNRTDWPKAPVLGHMSIPQKKIYLGNVQENLKVFRLTAGELAVHQRMTPEEAQKPCAGQGFRCEVLKYIELYAMPIINDTEALENVETRLEVAKVNLLSAYVFEETGQDNRARKLLKLFKKHYKNDASIQNAVVDPAEMGFSRLAEGAAALEAKLFTP
jgi:hypothetical protein